MKTITTNNGLEILLDDEDYSRLQKYSWFVDSNGYARRTDYTKGKVYKNRRKPLSVIKMHREVLGYVGKLDVDHIDGNKLNNQKLNLRIVSRSENGLNRHRLNSNNTSGYRGVSYYKWGNLKKRWVARFRGKTVGWFENKEDAVNALKGVFSY